MPPATPRLRILSIGGNSVSAFLSWRLTATNAADVSLVWKSGYEAVARFGISFRSTEFGNERFKPRYVVRTPEEATEQSRASFDYVILCVKALPDVYDLASVIESVVQPKHTCILVNTTNTIGIESYLEQRFPTNVVLSLVSGAEIIQLGPSEFEHKGSAELWVGAANKNPSIPAVIQTDMAQALSIVLGYGDVNCKVSPNIRQQQYERMIGPIAFFPTSVIFDTSSHAELLEKPGVRDLVTGVIDELIAIAIAQGCTFPSDFRETVMEQLIVPTDTANIMYQDFSARRPMEVETYLGSPIKLAQENKIAIPRIQTLYALMHNINIVNQSRPQTVQATQPVPPPHANGQRMPPPNGPKGPNGMMAGPHMNNGGPRAPSGRPGGRPPPGYGGPQPPNSSRGGRPSMGGFPSNRGNGYAARGPSHQQQRRGSMDNDLEEFSHLLLYDNMADSMGETQYETSSRDVALRERELAIRQKELALRERELNMRRGGPKMSHHRGGYDDEDDEDGEDYFDPMSGVAMAPMDDNFDMMSVTSRRTRKTPSISQMRANPDMMGGMPQSRASRNPWKRPPIKNRTSATIMGQMPNLRDELMNNPLMGYSSDRYANVDRHNLGIESRTNSLTAERLDELQNGGQRGGPYTGPRRTSQSPGHPLGAMPMQRPVQHRQMPPHGYGPQGAPGPMGRPNPAGPQQHRAPTGPNHAMPQNMEQQHVVSNLYPPKSGNQVRSLTGSASASAGSAESNRSAPLDSEPSAHSSSSSLGPRPPIGVR